MARAIVISQSRSRAKELAHLLRYVGRVDTATSLAAQRPWLSYRLVVVECDGAIESVHPLLSRLHPRTHIVLAGEGLDPVVVAREMADGRVNHFVRLPADRSDLDVLVRKLSTGAIFGLNPYLGADSQPAYHRLSSFSERGSALAALAEMTERKRLRSVVRRTAVQVADELLMNAMYHAPVDSQGRAIINDLDPTRLMRRRTPRPVSFRYAIRERVLYLSVRDRYGSLARSDLVTYIGRKRNGPLPMGRRTLGAGLGLYLVANSVTRLIVNILPGAVTEVVCTLEPPAEGFGLAVCSFTAQRPLIAPANRRD